MDANVFQSLALQREDDVLILHLLRPAEAGKIGRRPGIKEAQQGLQSGIIGPRKLFSVQLSECLQPSSASLLFDSRNAKGERGIVPEKE